MSVSNELQKSVKGDIIVKNRTVEANREIEISLEAEVLDNLKKLQESGKMTDDEVREWYQLNLKSLFQKNAPGLTAGTTVTIGKELDVSEALGLIRRIDSITNTTLIAVKNKYAKESQEPGRVSRNLIYPVLGLGTDLNKMSDRQCVMKGVVDELMALPELAGEILSHPIEFAKTLSGLLSVEGFSNLMKSIAQAYGDILLADGATKDGLYKKGRSAALIVMTLIPGGIAKKMVDTAKKAGRSTGAKLLQGTGKAVAKETPEVIAKKASQEGFEAVAKKGGIEADLIAGKKLKLKDKHGVEYSVYKEGDKYYSVAADGTSSRVEMTLAEINSSFGKIGAEIVAKKGGIEASLATGKKLKLKDKNGVEYVVYKEGDQYYSAISDGTSSRVKMTLAEINSSFGKVGAEVVAKKGGIEAGIMGSKVLGLPVLKQVLQLKNAVSKKLGNIKKSFDLLVGKKLLSFNIARLESKLLKSSKSVNLIEGIIARSNRSINRRSSELDKLKITGQGSSRGAKKLEDLIASDKSKLKNLDVKLTKANKALLAYEKAIQTIDIPSSLSTKALSLPGKALSASKGVLLSPSINVISNLINQFIDDEALRDLEATVGEYGHDIEREEKTIKTDTYDLKGEIVFDKGGASITDDMKAKVLEKMKGLDFSKVSSINITGWSSADGGSEKVNLALSSKRAEAMKQYIMDRYHIPSEKIETNSKRQGSDDSIKNDTNFSKYQSVELAITTSDANPYYNKEVVDVVKKFTPEQSIEEIEATKELEMAEVDEETNEDLATLAETITPASVEEDGA